MAVWPSGKAVDCKFSIPSSNLGAALKYLLLLLLFILNHSIVKLYFNIKFGDVVELVDTTDLKSVA